MKQRLIETLPGIQQSVVDQATDHALCQDCNQRVCQKTKANTEHLNYQFYDLLLHSIVNYRYVGFLLTKCGYEYTDYVAETESGVRILTGSSEIAVSAHAQYNIAKTEQNDWRDVRRGLQVAMRRNCDVF